VAIALGAAKADPRANFLGIKVMLMKKFFGFWGV
jgi:hypothetical protein